MARGYYTEEDVKILHQYMNQLLEKDGAQIDAFFITAPIIRYMVLVHIKRCAIAANRGTGMFEMAEKDFPVDKTASYMIGDKLL